MQYDMIITASLDELDRVVSYIESTIPDHAMIFLRGDLAAGKTTLTQAIAHSQGITTDVTSPTFSLQHIYGDRLYHYDLYRIDMDQFISLGLLEELESKGWHIIEWGSNELEALLGEIGFVIYEIAISTLDDKRRYTINQL